MVNYQNQKKWKSSHPTLSIGQTVTVNESTIEVIDNFLNLELDLES